MKATKVKVGQIRDVATGADVTRGVKRYARVAEVLPATGRAILTDMHGKRRRLKWLHHVARCRLVPPEEVSP